MRRVGQAAGDRLVEAGVHAIETLIGAVAGAEIAVPGVDVRGEQVGGVRVGAGNDDRRDAEDVGGEPSRSQRANVLAGRDEHLATHVTALLLGCELILEVDAGGAGGDEALGELEHVERPAEARLAVGHDRGEAPGLGVSLGPGDLIGAPEGVVDPLDQRRSRVGRVERLIRIHLSGQVGVTCHLPPREVDGVETGLDHLHGLATAHRPEGVDVLPGGHELPEAFGHGLGDRVRLTHAAAQSHDVLCAVGACDPLPSRIGLPVVLEFGDLLGKGGVLHECLSCFVIGWVCRSQSMWS